MGAGKSTVGQILADRLNRPLVDSDRAIEAVTGKTVREIWRSDGEPAFRRLESAALREALGAARPSVIAAAGGVVLAAQNRAALAGSRSLVVWLSAEPAVLVGRAARGEHRPLLDHDPEAALREMAAARESLYAEVADAVIRVDRKTPEEIVDEIVTLVGDG
jgi:shikimate kinase